MHLRDASEQVVPSGVDPFEKMERRVENEPSLGLVRLRTRKSKAYKKQHAAAHKYASTMKENRSKKKDKEPEDDKKVKILNNLFKEEFASVDELIEMNKTIVEFCLGSGCSLLEVLYGMNEAIPQEKRLFESSSIIDSYNEQLVRLSESRDLEAEREVENEFVELIIKKIERIASLYKPGSFSGKVLANIDLEKAIKSVKKGLGSMHSLLETKTKERLFNTVQCYSEFA